MYGYINKKALLDYARNQKDGKIDSNDIARFPRADVAPKSEVAREIFDELLEKIELISIVAQPTDGFTQGVIKTFNKTSALISELKKKYTEEKT